MSNAQVFLAADGMRVLLCRRCYVKHCMSNASAFLYANLILLCGGSKIDAGVFAN